MKEERRRNRKRLLIFLLVVVPALLILAWSQASLNLSPLRPTSANETILLLALSSLIFLALVIFGLILARILLKLYVERRQHQLGSRFKTKLVVAFLAMTHPVWRLEGKFIQPAVDLAIRLAEKRDRFGAMLLE